MKIRDIKNGQIFYEKEMGQYIQCMAISDPYQKDETSTMWHIKVRTMYGESEFSQDEKCMHYGPRLSERDY